MPNESPPIIHRTRQQLRLFLLTAIQQKIRIKLMFGEQSTNYSSVPGEPAERHPLFNKSRNMQDVLYGTPQINSSYFVDSLERFKKDFASVHHEEREIFRDKLNNTVAKKQQDFLEQKQIQQANSSEEAMRQSMQLSYQQQLWDLGLRKNGMTTGIPVNPINHEYATNYRGQQFQRQESEKRLNNMLRLHHLQTKGSCGYNPINGKENTSVKNLIPEGLEYGMDSRIQEYKDRYSLRPPGWE